MPNKTYNGTNPITDILGDLPTEREVTMTGLSTLTRIEPLTNTQIPAGQTVLVNVIGNMAHAQLVKNIQQINALEGFEVIGVTSVVMSDVNVVGGLRLIPTGATESADGDHQVFSKNATAHPVFGADGFSADLGTALVDLSDAFISVSIKAPDITADGQFFGLSFAQTDVQNLPTAPQAYFQISRSGDVISTVLVVTPGNADRIYSRILPNFAAGEEVTLYFHPRHVRAVSVYGESWIDLNEGEAVSLWSGDLFNVVATHLSPTAALQPYSVKAQVAPRSALPAPPMDI